MTPERWGKLKSLFGQAVALDPTAQSRFLRDAGLDDPEIENSLRSLVKHHDSASALLDGPLISQERIVEYLTAGVRTFQNDEIAGGRFRIERFIGEGGMGEVYAAEDLDLGETVALKTLRPSLASNQDLLARFKFEIQIARKVTHPNVCRVFDLFWHRLECESEYSTIAFLTMELLEGETLEEKIRRDGRILETEALPLVQQIVSGLSAAHAAGVVHRDFKSGNILLVHGTGGSRAVITDFGLAKPVEKPGSTAGPAGRVEGTLAYLAPEQMNGGRMTPATDIYGLGVVLFEMMTGDLPFPGASSWETAAEMRATPPSPRAVIPTLDGGWESAILACLEPDPAKRPQSAAQVLDRIRNRTRSRRTLLVALFGAVAAVTAAGLWLRPQPINPDALRSFKRGEDFAQRRNRDGLKNAVEEFRHVVALEPGYAPAWIGLADAYSAMGNFDLMNPHQALTSAKQAAARAIAIDPQMGKAQGIFGRITSLDVHDWLKAEPYLRRAVAVDPKDAAIRLWYGAYLGKLGRSQEALVQLRAGLEQAPSSMPLNHQLATEFFRAHRFTEFTAQARELVRLQPFEPNSHLVLARALEWQKQYEEALVSCEEAERLKNSETALCYRGAVEAARGNKPVARQIAARLREHWKSKPFESALLAALYSQLGDLPAALEVLDEGYRRDDSTILTVPANPYFDPFRSDPGFRRFLDTICWPAHLEKK